MKKPELLAPSALQKRPRNFESEGDVMDDIVAEARPARKEPSARPARMARGFRVPLEVHQRFDQNRDRYNAERDPSSPKLTLDQQAQLAFELFLEECERRGVKSLIDKLRAPRA